MGIINEGDKLIPNCFCFIAFGRIPPPGLVSPKAAGRGGKLEGGEGEGMKVSSDNYEIHYGIITICVRRETGGEGGDRFLEDAATG